MKRWGIRLHAAIYRLTRGRILGRVGGQPVLLLETSGRRTGLRRRTPVQYLRVGETLVVVGSNAGARRAPAWSLNLRADPKARVQVRGHGFEVVAREATGDERATLWRQLTAANRYLADVAHKAARELPLVVLTPAGSGEPTVVQRTFP